MRHAQDLLRARNHGDAILHLDRRYRRLHASRPVRHCGHGDGPAEEPQQPTRTFASAAPSQLESASLCGLIYAIRLRSNDSDDQVDEVYEMFWSEGQETEKAIWAK